MGTNAEIKAIADLRGVSVKVHEHVEGYSWVIYEHDNPAVWGYTVYKHRSDAKAKGRNALRYFIIEGK